MHKQSPAKQMIYYPVRQCLFLLFIGLGHVMPVLAQHAIENIRAEAHQDTIVLTYKLAGAQPGEQFKIRAYCQTGFGNIIEMKAVEEAKLGGTVVAGGTHRLTWHVLNDEPNGITNDSVTFTLIAVPPTGPNLTLPERKALLYRELTGITNLYLEQLYDQKVYLEYFNNAPFESNWAYDMLAKQRETFNKTYQNLLEKHQAFELGVDTLWGNSARETTEKFFGAILITRNSTHQNLLDSYNKILVKMNLFVQGSGRLKKTIVDDIQRDIRNVTTDPDSERAELRAAAANLYQKLHP